MPKLIITGSTRGIGKAITEKFAEQGFDIAFCGSTMEGVQTAETGFKKRFGIKIGGFVADLSDKRQTQMFAEQALGFLKGCDVLINNAGVFIPGSIEKESDETFEKQMSINLNAAYYLTKALLPEIKKGIRPHVFNMCSIASIVAYPNGSSYCISKFALLGFTKVLRQELIPAKVGVTAVMPGATITESWGDTSLPIDRFIQPQNIADAIWNAYSMNESAVIEEMVLRPLDGDI